MPVDPKRDGDTDSAVAATIHRLMENPADAGTLRMLGLLAHRTGKLDAAVDLARLAADPPTERADGYAHLGNALRKLGRPGAAIDSFQRALSERWNFPEALCDLGNALVDAGRLTEAVAAYHSALLMRPDDAIVHANVGSALRSLGRLDEAVTNFHRALVLAPGLRQARVNLANALADQGDVGGAIACYHAALAETPDDARLHHSLAMLLASANRPREAAEAHRRSLAIEPDNAAAHCHLGGVLLSLGEHAAARQSYAAAVARAPHDAVIRSNIAYGLHYDPTTDDAALFEAHRDFDRDVAAPLLPAELRHANDRDPERPLRVGYVSADFCRHPVGYFMLPVLAGHDPRAIQAICYSGTAVEDDMTARLRRHAVAWHATAGLDDAALADQIRADSLDILVDLAGHTGGNRLTMFARKPAPVQVSWLGYFNTTGMRAIDYVVMDDVCVPPGAERFFTERVVRLKTSRLCYEPPDDAPLVAAPPSTVTGHTTFGSFNNLGKLTAEVVALWAAVLRAVPGSRLLLKWGTLADPTEQARWRASFAAHGIDPARLVLRGSSPHVGMLAEYGDVDIALDPFPFCGGLTSCEALWMGVPIVTLPGRRVVSRQTLSFLTQIGATELAADSPEHYVAIAAGLAADPAALGRLRASLRPRMASSPLCDRTAFTRALEAAYRTMWRDWCGSVGRHPTDVARP